MKNNKQIPGYEVDRMHTQKDAEYCLWYIKKMVHKDSTLIGNLGRGADHSRHDIDIYIPNFFPKGIMARMRAAKLRQKMFTLLDAKKVENTDWGGWFFHDTAFGNVDIFFDISEFDY